MVSKGHLIDNQHDKQGRNERAVDFLHSLLSCHDGSEWQRDESMSFIFSLTSKMTEPSRRRDDNYCWVEVMIILSLSTLNSLDALAAAVTYDLESTGCTAVPFSEDIFAIQLGKYLSKPNFSFSNPTSKIHLQSTLKNTRKKIYNPQCIFYF